MPGVSTRNTNGMLKALQMRTKRVAFSDESVSSTPDITLG